MQKILVIEDYDFNQLLAESLLKVWGYKPIVSNNAMDALQLLKKEKFDMILLDLMMPKMDGFEFLRHLHKRKDNTPVIVISALTDEENIEKAMGLGAISYITKPYDSQYLKSKLSSYFSQKT